MSREVRRFVAVLVLLAGLGLAWYSRPKTAELQVAWLLTHIDVPVGEVRLDRSRLIELTWRVPAAAGSKQTATRQTLRFSQGNAPEVTPPSRVRLPPGVQSVEVTCVFALAAGSAPVRSRTKLQIDPARGEQQTVDVDTCGTLDR